MKALMVVDMQKGFEKENDRSLNESINKYLREEKFDNVIYTQFYNHIDSPYIQFLGYTKMLRGGEIELCVDEVKNSFIFQKCTYGLSEKQLKFLKEKHINEVILCGCDIDACVLAIAFNLFDSGIRPLFKWDLCGSKNDDKEAKERVKPLLLRNFGKDCLI